MNTQETEDREKISRKVRDLREGRRWTQAELSRRLGLSQSRLSEIENGQGSFTAEQFLEILKLFNVPVTHFVRERSSDNESEIQNALARLGARHLQESSEVLPSDRLTEVGVAVREVLIAGGPPRHLTSLAAVLVDNIDRLNLPRTLSRLVEAGVERRLGWLIDNTLDAIRRELRHDLPRRWKGLYQRAELLLDSFLSNWHRREPLLSAPDILDPDIRTKKSLDETETRNSPISRRWGVVSALQPEDFVEALRASRAGH